MVVEYETPSMRKSFQKLLPPYTYEQPQPASVAAAVI